MQFSKAIALLSALAFQAQAAPAPASSAVDYGSWSIEVIIGASATGYRFGDLYANHTKNPGVTSHSRWVYSPIFDNTTFTSDDPTLSNTIIEAAGVHAFEIKQALTIDGVNTPLKGSGSIDMVFRPAANGRGAQGKTTIASGPA